MNEYVKLSMKEFKLNPLHYVSLPGYSFDCWLMSSGVKLDTLQDKQMLDDFVGAKRGGICVYLLFTNILELTINDDRKLIEVAIILYNELC